MSIMAESGQAENDVYLERPAATRVSVLKTNRRSQTFSGFTVC